MKKAQNLIEVSLILVLVVVVSLTLWPMLNNQKMKLINLSKVNISKTANPAPILSLSDIRAKAAALSASMGLAVSNNVAIKDIMSLIISQLNQIEAMAGSDASQLAQVKEYQSKFIEIVNDLATLDAANGGKTKTEINNLASSIGISSNNNSNMGEIMDIMRSEIRTQLFSAGSNQPKLVQANDNRAKYNDIISELSQSATVSRTTTSSYTNNNTSAPTANNEIEVSGSKALTSDITGNSAAPAGSGFATSPTVPGSNSY